MINATILEISYRNSADGLAIHRRRLVKDEGRSAANETSYISMSISSAQSTFHESLPCFYNEQATR